MSCQLWKSCALCLAVAVLAVPLGADELVAPEETHLENVRQLTFGGENAEAYWSPNGRELIFQATRGEHPCDQIFRLEVPEPGEAAPEPKLVSTGQGRTTCAYFHASGERILYASTHEANEDCPPPPDRSQGYVWALYDGYEIYSANLDGSDLTRLTDNDVYDAEATVCPVDGSIVFTSTRDGDLELYSMDADGSNVERLTHTPGYDGGAFFNADCSKIVWRASRFEGEELEDYQRLLEQDLVRPGQLEIWVAEADGSDPRQVTYLDAASFAPYFFPSGDRILFSTNYGDPRGREFDLWAIDVDGTDLERITHSPGFDGFPMFSPDGKQLAFASNRNQGAPGETNVFVADWVDHAVSGDAPVRPADRVHRDVAWLADDAREGRGVGTEGLAESARYLAERFRLLGLEPGGETGYLSPLEVPVSVEIGPETRLVVDGNPLPEDAYRPASFSLDGEAAGPVVPVGYGITSPELGVDDYEGLDVEGKIVVVRRFVPAGETFEDESAERRYSDLRYKAFNAREHGAVGLLVVDLPEVAEGSEMPEEAPLPGLGVTSRGDAGLPVAFLTREAGRDLFDGESRVEMRIDLEEQRVTAHNVVAQVPAGAAEPQDGAVLVGAHYDHLGLGGSGSLSPDAHEPHNGADDNASGTAALLEIGRLLAQRRGELERDVWLVAFTAEESGLLGSTHLVRHPPKDLEVESLVAMINLDMVGRLRRNTLQVLGSGSAEEWDELLPPVCAEERIQCDLGGSDGYGPSDQTPFYAAGVPVLHLFTGTHEDYHKPSDDVGTIHAGGIARVAAWTAEVAARLAQGEESLTYRESAAPEPRGDVRSYGASLGTIPDYAGPEDDAPGVLLAGVRPDSPADQGGLQRGDLLVELAGHPIRDIHDFMFVLRKSKPHEDAKAVVMRGGERVELQVTFGVNRRMR